MTEQFEKPVETKDETISNAAAEKRTERVADKEAEKASQTEKSYDENHQIFSK